MIPVDDQNPTHPSALDAVAAAEFPTDGHYRAMFDAVALPVLTIDSASWRIVAANEAALAQYGYTRDEFIGMSVLEVRPTEGREEARRILMEMPHGFWKTTAVAHCRKDGSLFRADVWSRDTVIEGRPVRVCTICDVTERVQLQHELQHAQRMESVGRLAGGIAHDFNNVLTTIIGSVELLAQDLNDAGAPAIELAAIREAADRAASLTRKLLAYSRKQFLQPEVLLLSEAVRRVVPLIRPALGDTVELRLDLDARAGAVRIDPAHFDQVLLNLALNARDAMPQGGTFMLRTLRADFARDVVIGGATVPAGEYAELRVTDSGIGMDEATRVRIFEPFFTTKPLPEGTGLGLSMAYGIVRQSGGYITVDSAPGRGATFRVFLPEAARESRPAADRVAVSGRTGRIALIAVDDDGLRRLTRRALEQLGFLPVEPAAGEAVPDMIRRFRSSPALLVTDQSPPRTGMPGLGALLDAHPDLRILFLAGDSDDGGGTGDLVRPGVAILPRPFSLETLGEAARLLFRPASTGASSDS